MSAKKWPAFAGLSFLITLIENQTAMLLRDLKPGQRFEFVDKETPVVRLDLLNFRADQIFVFAGIDGNCPLLQIHSYLTGSGKKKYTVSPLTFSREVFILL